MDQDASLARQPTEEEIAQRFLTLEIYSEKEKIKFLSQNKNVNQFQKNSDK
jgi:hypothetical protein